MTDLMRKEGIVYIRFMDDCAPRRHGKEREDRRTKSGRFTDDQGPGLRSGSITLFEEQNKGSTRTVSYSWKAPCCTGDEGRPLGTGLQEQVPNHLKLRR